MVTIEEKASYLEMQAHAFLKSKEYTDAVEVCHYILNNVDRESIKAQDILEKAQKELSGAMKGALKGLGGK